MLLNNFNKHASLDKWISEPNISWDKRVLSFYFFTIDVVIDPKIFVEDSIL